MCKAAGLFCFILLTVGCTSTKVNTASRLDASEGMSQEDLEYQLYKARDRELELQLQYQSALAVAQNSVDALTEAKNDDEHRLALANMRALENEVAEASIALGQTRDQISLLGGKISQVKHRQGGPRAVNGVFVVDMRGAEDASVSGEIAEAGAPAMPAAEKPKRAEPVNPPVLDPASAPVLADSQRAAQEAPALKQEGFSASESKEQTAPAKQKPARQENRMWWQRRGF